jgi:hypothetical protein
MRWLRAAHGRASEVRLILTCHRNRGGLTRLLTARPTGRSGGVDAQSVNERDTSCEWRRPPLRRGWKVGSDPSGEVAAPLPSASE